MHLLGDNAELQPDGLVDAAGFGEGGVGFGVVVEFQAEVVPDYAGGDVAGGDGEGEGVFAGLEEFGVELLGVLVPDALVGVVADGVGGHGVDGARVLSVDGDG
jgi:hypothetical protein